MNPISILICRRILQAADTDTFDGISDDASLSAPINAAVTRPFSTTAPFDSSMALTILVLLTALFFLVFFSIYIRRFAAAAAAAAAEDHPSPHSPDPRRRTPPSSNNKGGLDASAVDSLPLVAYGRAAKHPMIDDCPICLSEFRERETVKLIPYCGHVFHPVCIDTWLASRVTCPLCRSAQLFKEVCLDVTQDKDEISVSEVGERSTVENDDAWRLEGSAGETGTCSCSNSANRRVVLERSTSY